MASQVRRHSDEAFFKPPRVFPQRDGRGFPIGKQQRRRQAENKELNKKKINHCEAPVDQIAGKKICVKNIMLTWSHALKTRLLITKVEWQRAARQCKPCHQWCEDNMSHKKRAAFIDAAIARRK